MLTVLRLQFQSLSLVVLDCWRMINHRRVLRAIAIDQDIAELTIRSLADSPDVLPSDEKAVEQPGTG